MNQLGRWSALGLFMVGVIYAIVVAFGMYFSGLTNPIIDPMLAIMEILSLIAAPLLVIVMSAIHSSAHPESKIYSLIALAFMLMAAALTSAVHFVGLTALRQTGLEGLVWPSPLYAVELLAWDVMLGLSLLFAAPVFRGERLKQIIRGCLLITGTFCLVGTIGPFTGNMKIQFISVLGYGVFLPAVWLLIAKDFQNAYRE